MRRLTADDLRPANISTGNKLKAARRLAACAKAELPHPPQFLQSVVFAREDELTDALDMLTGILGDYEATVAAIEEHGGPIVSVGQFRRIITAKELIAKFTYPERKTG